MIENVLFDAMLASGAVVVTETEDGFFAKWDYKVLEKKYPRELDDIIWASIKDPTQRILLQNGYIAPVVVDEDTVEFKTTVQGKRFQKFLTSLYGK